MAAVQLAAGAGKRLSNAICNIAPLYSEWGAAAHLSIKQGLDPMGLASGLRGLAIEPPSA